MNATVQHGYAPVNGLNLYYEVRGAGETLIMLHGGVVGIEMFGSNLDTLATSRLVISVELQGHGRTADIDRALSCEALADDVAALMRHLAVERADVLGLSLGGGVALQFAIRHSALLRRLVVVSAPFARNGWYPEVLAAFDAMGPDSAEPLLQSPLAERFPQVDWRMLFAKIGAMQRQEYDWSEGTARIAAPTLLVFADADAIRPAHMIEFFALLGGGQHDAGLDGSGRPPGQLAILPGLTHYDIAGSPALAAVVGPFLDAD
jgi:pimeloyl-ACP methyl ester carboxylesterase